MLLQTLKFKHKERLKNLTENLTTDVDNLKKVIELTMNSSRGIMSGGTVFRANHTAKDSTKETLE